MKWIIPLALAAVFALMLSGCAAHTGETEAGAVEYDAVCIKYMAAVALPDAEPVVDVFDTAEALAVYTQNLSADELDALNTELASLGALFDGRRLASICFAAGSGSIRVEVSGVTQESGVVTVHIRKLTPEVCTMDMAYWTVFVALPEGDAAVTAELAELPLTE